MNPDDIRILATTVHERLGALDQKNAAAIQAAHTRIDKLEDMFRDDLREIKADVKEIGSKMQDLVKWAERSKGWAAAALLFATALGAILAKTVTLAFTK